MKKTLVVAVCMCLVAVAEAAKIKVKSAPDPTFDFSKVRTWAWDADAGDVIMARTATDDPAPLKQRLDPMIRTFVESEMTKKGLSPAPNDAADVQLHYYVLVTVNTSGQYMGQFLPAVPYWGLPPFPPATTSVTVVTRGSLVLDAMLPGPVGTRKVVWRGIAESTVRDDDKDDVRTTRIKDACAELVKRFPARKQR